MAKDGTGRGGARIGAGRKPKSLREKILEGVENLPQNIKENQTKIKNPKSYLSDKQKDNSITFARQIYRETYNWLEKNNCAEIVPQMLIENFAQTTARYIQAEQAISKTGLLAYSATGAITATPLIKISLEYLKTAQNVFCQIYQMAKANSFNLADDGDPMEQILQFKGGMK